MGLRERITRRPDANAPALGGNSALVPEVRAQDTYHELKQTIHRQLIDRLDLASLENVENEFLQQQVDRVVRTLLKEQDLRLSPTDEERLVKEIRDETFGLGPIEPLLHDPEISDILVNTYRQVFVERRGKLELTNVTFPSDAASTRPRLTLTPACRTARASTPSSRRSPSTDRCSPSVASR